MMVQWCEDFKIILRIDKTTVFIVEAVLIEA